MISSLLSFVFKTFMFILRVISFVYHLANTTSLGFILIIAIVIFVLSRYFRLKQPNLPQNLIDAIGSNQHIDRQCLTGQVNQRCHSSDTLEWWPIANRAASLDSLENSRSAIEKCVAQSCRSILLDVNITKCGQLVIFHEKTLRRVMNEVPNGVQKASNEPKVSFSRISLIKLDDLKALNITKNHPLCEKHPHESVLQFNDLMQLLDMHEKINVFLLMGSTSKQIVSNISRYFENNPERFKRIIICSRSPKVIFQLRKMNPQFICALWLDKVTKLFLPSLIVNSTFFSFLYGLLYRNIIAVLTGISAVFIHKHDFNAHIAQMWRNANIQPIVYTLNSPNEKRYFQQTLRTQYLTESLRSEPSNFVKITK